LAYGTFLNKGFAHGVSLSIEIIVLQITVLYMIGKPVDTPISEILNKEIIIPLIPLLPIGSLSGYLGGKVRKKSRMIKTT
jgi:hypothetical protein